MKKFILSIALVAAAATTAFAQIEGLSVGAGYTTSTMKVTATSGSTTNTDTQEFGGFYAGASYTVLTLGPGIGITPGLYFSSVSYKKDKDILGGVESGSESYLNLPINFSYKLDLVPGTLAIAPYVGPTFSLGLASKVKYENGSTTNTTDLYGDDSDYSKFNIAIGGGLALDIVDMIRVTVGYNYGLLNRYTGDQDPVKYNYNNNTGFNFGVAYLF